MTSALPSRHTDLAFAAGCATVALVNYASTLCPTVGPGDSGELTLAALTLGVCHPPGYPLFTWLGRIACLLPFREPALATNSLTALLAALAIAATFFAARTLRLSPVASVVAALSLGFSPALWSSATSHEVYSLGLLFLALSLLLAAGTDGGSARSLLGAFVFGLAVSHQPTALLWVPALAVIAFRPGSRPASLLVPAGLLFLLGFSASLGTMVRATAHPALNWGDPSTLTRFLQHITASQYRGLALGVPSAEFSRRLAGLPVDWMRDAGLPAAVLALAGVGYLAAGRRRLLLGLLLLAATALFAVSFDIPDFRVHLLPSVLAVALLAGAGAHIAEQLLARVQLSGRLKPLGAAFTAAGVLALLAVPGYSLMQGRHANTEMRTTVVRDLGANLLLSLPDSTVFLTSSDVSRNAVEYVQSMEKVRGDVLVIPVDLLFNRTYYVRLARQVALPDHLSAVAAAGTGARPERLQRLIAQLVEAVVGSRPILLGTDMMTADYLPGRSRAGGTPYRRA